MHAGNMTHHPLPGDLLTCKTDLIQTYQLLIMICKFPMDQIRP